MAWKNGKCAPQANSPRLRNLGSYTYGRPVVVVIHQRGPCHNNICPHFMAAKRAEISFLHSNKTTSAQQSSPTVRSPQSRVSGNITLDLNNAHIRSHRYRVAMRDRSRFYSKVFNSVCIVNQPLVAFESFNNGNS